MTQIRPKQHWSNCRKLIKLDAFRLGINKYYMFESVYIVKSVLVVIIFHNPSYKQLTFNYEFTFGLSQNEANGTCTNCFEFFTLRGSRSRRCLPDFNIWKISLHKFSFFHLNKRESRNLRNFETIWSPNVTIAKNDILGINCWVYMSVLWRKIPGGAPKASPWTTLKCSSDLKPWTFMCFLRELGCV